MAARNDGVVVDFVDVGDSLPHLQGFGEAKGERGGGGGAIFTQLNDRGCGGVADVGEFLPHLQGQGEVWGAVSSQLNSRGCGVVVDMGDFSLTCNDWMGGGGGEKVGEGGAIFTHINRWGCSSGA